MGLAFPTDDYTPHGYLDTPTHTRNLSPRGVLRSWEAGFCWRFPAHAGMYGGRRETYQAGMRLGLNGALNLAGHANVTSPYHSKDVIQLDLAQGAARASASWQLVGEHVLHASVALQGAGRLVVHAQYCRLLAARGEWGESGLVGRRVADGLVLQGFEDGEAFVLWASLPPADWGITSDPAALSGWAAGKARQPAADFVTTIGHPGEQVALHALLGFALPGPDLTLELFWARGVSAAAAWEHLAQARQGAAAALAGKRVADAAFWSAAPQLQGDWPAHWRRGLVYDLETVRMMVRAPYGCYRHPWDAMQIQAPRVVLAEAAMDAMLLGYADPAQAQELLLGVFADAPTPQVPCSREDGSYNMVAADGTVCGTAPSWGYPLLALEWLWTLRPARSWLAQIYPLAAAYLRWWLDQRRDSAGWLVYACSWEAGQDDSPRFGAQPLGGGHPVRHVYPVDLQAAVAHGAGVLARCAALLDRPDEAAEWLAHSSAFAERTARLWHGTRYADYDTQRGGPTQVDDLMLLAPLALGVATPAHGAALRDQIAAIRPAALTWPPPTWTAVAAAQSAGQHAVAAELAGAVCERAYRYWDARRANPRRTLPGIACEFWPLDGRCGGEGYGWGAWTTHLLLHVLVGLVPSDQGLLLRPNLPGALRVPGRSYRLTWHWRGQPLALTLAPLDQQRVAVTCNGSRSVVDWGQQHVFSES